MARTEAELAEIDDEKVYWEELTTLFGWKLRSWTGRDIADCKTGRGPRHGLFTICGCERDDIVRAIDRRYSCKPKRRNCEYLRRPYQNGKTIPVILLLLVIGIALIVWGVK